MDFEAPPKRPRGRPRGSRSALLASSTPLRQQHFSFLRAWAEGIEPRRAWERYLSFAADVPERSLGRHQRRLLTQVHAAAQARGLGEEVRRALHGLGAAARIGRRDPAARQAAEPASPLSAIPALDAWIAQRCRDLGIEADFLSQAEWLAEYREEFDLDRAEGALSATSLQADGTDPRANATGRRAVSLREQLEAINLLAGALARPPSLSDPLAAWLAPAVARSLQRVGIATLAELIAFTNTHGNRWHRHVSGVGARCARRLVDWLAPLADQLGRPLADAVQRMAAHMALAPPRQGLLASARSAPDSPIAPLERMQVPQELDGRDGALRLPGENSLRAGTDIAAVRGWLELHTESASTRLAYTRAVERFHLWCVLERRVALSSATTEDLRAFVSFLAAPPPGWIQRRNVPRTDGDWRPFRGPLSPASQRQTLAALSALFTGLTEAGYLAASALGVIPLRVMSGRAAAPRHGLSETQWHWVSTAWDALYRVAGPAPNVIPNSRTDGAAAVPSPGLADIAASICPDQRPAVARALRRTRLVLELGAASGWKLGELVSARLADLHRSHRGGELGGEWVLRRPGSPDDAPVVRLPEGLKALIDRHQLDQAAAGHGVGSVDALFAPLIGPLRPRPRRWALDQRGTISLERTPDAARFGHSLDRSALYQSLKRLFLAACRQAAAGGDAEAARSLRQASTEWLRRTDGRRVGPSNTVASEAVGSDVAP